MYWGNMPEPFQNIVLRQERLSDQVKHHLKQAILDGKFKPGDKLPPENQIAEMFKVSKVTAREALREMETEGLIEKRRGTHGGSFVAQPGSEKIGQVVNNFYRFGALTPEELVEFRQILEPALVALAVERRTDDDLKAIKANIEAVEASISQGRQNQPKAIEFHRLIADACHNRLISAVMEAMVQVFLEILSQIPFTLEDAQGDLEYNKKFYEYLLHGNKEKARKLMETHFDTLAEIVERWKNEG
jgi:GntR family transcriptional repressor for pyruvate dehydrogenase complex